MSPKTYGPWDGPASIRPTEETTETFYRMGIGLICAGSMDPFTITITLSGPDFRRLFWPKYFSWTPTDELPPAKSLSEAMEEFTAKEVKFACPHGWISVVRGT